MSLNPGSCTGGRSHDEKGVPSSRFFLSLAHSASAVLIPSAYHLRRFSSGLLLVLHFIFRLLELISGQDSDGPVLEPVTPGGSHN